MTCPTLLVSRNTRTTFTGQIGASAASSVLTKPAGRTARSSRAIWITSWTSWCFTRHVREAGMPVLPPMAIARTCAWLCLSAVMCAAARRITRSTTTTRPAAVSSICTPLVLDFLQMLKSGCLSVPGHSKENYFKHGLKAWFSSVKKTLKPFLDQINLYTNNPKV